MNTYKVIVYDYRTYHLEVEADNHFEAQAIAHVQIGGYDGDNLGDLEVTGRNVSLYASQNGEPDVRDDPF